MKPDRNITGDSLSKGDPHKFRILFEDYYSALVSYAVKYTEKHSSAENIVQGVFMKLWEHRSSLATVSNIPSYLYQMVRNRSLNHVRDKKIKADHEFKYHETAYENEVEDDMIPEETYRIIHKAVDRLPESCRKIFILSLSGYTAKEIADDLDISVDTVKKQKQIARKKLREMLDNIF